MKSALAVLLALSFASTRDGVYTPAQAERGESVYKRACASCHGDTLRGSGAATPPLAGSDFTAQWTGQTLDDLLERIQTSMLADHPGTLKRDETASIVAYLLRENKLPAGKSDLPTDAAALQQIQFEAAK